MPERATPAFAAPWGAMLARLEERVTLAVGLLLVIVIGGMFWLSHSRVVDAVSSSELSRLQTSADQLAGALQSQARRLVSDGSRVAAIPALSEALRNPRSSAAVSAAVRAMQSTASAQVHDVTLMDRSGTIVASTGSPDPRLAKPDNATQLETVAGPVVSGLVARSDTVAYSVTAPIIGLSGARIGYVVISRQLTGQNATASLMNGLVGRGARVFLGNADGTLLTDLVKPLPRSVRPHARGGATYQDPTGGTMLGATALITDTPWMVLVEAPRISVLGAASKFTRDIAIVGGLFVVIGALLSWVLIRRTMRPLGEVTDAARDIAGGNLARRAAVTGRSEIAVLGDAFNQMVERVGQSATDLAARATQLEVSNKELNESEAKYRSLFEHLPDGVVVHSDDRILFANPSALRLLGVGDEAELLRHPMLDFVVPIDRDTVRARIARVVGESAPVPTVEIRMQRLDRRVATVEATSMPLRINGFAAVQTILHDVSERRLLEEQFRQSQKMDAVGRLAGGVAHDFNNLLTVIQAHAEFALSTSETEEDRRKDIEEIKKTAENAARLTRQLLTFSRKQGVTPSYIDLNESITAMLAMIKRLIGDNIEVLTVAGKDLSGIWADPGQIQQVLLNLAVNARDAMPDGGVLRFETANITVGEGYVGAASSAIPEGQYVMLAVQDTGVGMTEEIRSRVFEPFFTTKQPGQGTGLGLSTVYGIVKQSGGHIWVYSEPGMGTAFKVFFPPHHGEEAPHRPSAAHGAMSGDQCAHLLVVEDDASVRTAVVRALRGAGYTVTEATQAEEALSAITGDPSIDLLITDMVMPGKPGVALLAEARGHRSELPAIVLSGYSEQPAKELWSLPENAVFVEKPVSPSALIRRVVQLLAARG
jgi:PAS domain S-box-containing protein